MTELRQKLDSVEAFIVHHNEGLSILQPNVAPVDPERVINYLVAGLGLSCATLMCHILPRDLYPVLPPLLAREIAEYLSGRLERDSMLLRAAESMRDEIEAQIQHETFQGAPEV